MEYINGIIRLTLVYITIVNNEKEKRNRKSETLTKNVSFFVVK